MATDALQDASDALRRASEAAESDDVRERLYEHSDRLAQFASAGRGPDHGQLARVERQASSAAEGAGGDVAAAVEEAVDRVHDYREDLEGV